MKKFLALLIALTLVLSLGAFTALATDGYSFTYSASEVETAAQDDEEPVNLLAQSIPVTASSTVLDNEPEIVYSVVIIWEDPGFVYTVDNTTKWNPETHEYELIDGEGVWVGTGNILITNHSNTKIRVDLEYTAKEGFEDIEGAFSYTDDDENTVDVGAVVAKELASAYNESEPVLYEDAASLEYELNLIDIGEIDLGDIANGVEIGSIEITISQPIIA